MSNIRHETGDHIHHNSFGNGTIVDQDIDGWFLIVFDTTRPKLHGGYGAWKGVVRKPPKNLPIDRCYFLPPNSFTNVTKGQPALTNSRMKEDAQPLLTPTPEWALTRTQRTILQHIRRAGSISTLDAMVGYHISGGSLTARISELQKHGYKFNKVSKRHPINGRRYTRYSLAE